jgi:predicted porin
MKKFLLATTALAGASLVAGTAFAAEDIDLIDYLDVATDLQDQDGASPVVQSQPAFAIRISGSVRVSARWTDQDRKEMSQSFDLIDDDHSLAVNGSATADNGLSYGFVYDVDENRGEIHLSNRFGRIDMGDTSTATDALKVNGSSILVGRGHYAGGGDKNVNHRVTGGRTLHHRGTGGTIRYSTPNYGGLTVAVSYTNEADNNSNMTDGGDAGHEDIFSIAGQYTSSYGNYTTVVFVGYEQANRAVKAQQDGIGTDSENGNQDDTIFSIGAKVTGMGAGFAIGWGTVDVDTSSAATSLADKDIKWYDIALMFGSGPWSISGGAMRTIKDDASIIGVGNVDQKQTAFSLSTNYALAPGLNLGGGVTHYSIDNSGVTRVNNSATTITFATSVSF